MILRQMLLTSEVVTLDDKMRSKEVGLQNRVQQYPLCLEGQDACSNACEDRSIRAAESQVVFQLASNPAAPGT